MASNQSLLEHLKEHLNRLATLDENQPLERGLYKIKQRRAVHQHILEDFYQLLLSQVGDDVDSLDAKVKQELSTAREKLGELEATRVQRLEETYKSTKEALKELSSASETNDRLAAELARCPNTGRQEFEERKTALDAENARIQQCIVSLNASMKQFKEDIAASLPSDSQVLTAPSPVDTTSQSRPQTPSRRGAESNLMSEHESTTPRTVRQVPSNLAIRKTSSISALRKTTSQFPHRSTTSIAALRKTPSLSNIQQPGLRPSTSTRQLLSQVAEESLSRARADPFTTPNRRPRADTPSDDTTQQRSPQRLRGNDGQVLRNPVPVELRESTWAVPPPETEDLEQAIQEKIDEWLAHSGSMFKLEDNIPPPYPVMSRKGQGPWFAVDTSVAATKKAISEELKKWVNKDPRNKTDPYGRVSTCADGRKCLLSFLKAAKLGAPPMPHHEDATKTRGCESCNNNRLCLRMERTTEEHCETTGQRWRVWAMGLEDMPSDSDDGTEFGRGKRRSSGKGASGGSKRQSGVSRKSSGGGRKM